MKRLLIPLLTLFFATQFLFVSGWLFWNAFESVREAISFQPYPLPYRATIVGFDSRKGVRSTTYAPIVEVVAPNRNTFRFKSSRSSLLNLMSVGDSVEVIAGPAENILGRPTEKFEINNAFHLWVKDVLIALLIPAIAVASFFWSWLRTFWGAQIASPIRALRRKPA